MRRDCYRCRSACLCLLVTFLSTYLRPASSLQTAPPPTAASASPQDQTLALDIFRQLIEINTTHSVGSVTAAADALRARLLAAGFPAEDVTLAGPSERKQNLIVHFRGQNKEKTIVIFAHLDVVEAQRSDWSVDPFRFLEKDGYYYGRGTQDIKDNDAIAIETFIRLKREGYQPRGDLLLLLTADEEAGPDDGMAWLLQHRPELFQNVWFTLNLDAGDLSLKQGRPSSMGFEVAEKVYADFELGASDRGGHSSLPHAGNPIQHIADGLTRLQAAPFPLELNPITTAYFAGVAPGSDPATRALMLSALQSPKDEHALAALAASSDYANALLRTTCVPTRFAGGHANNALPNAATANINCRILPGHSPAEVQRHIMQALADPSIEIRYCSSQGKCGAAPESTGAPPVVLLPVVLRALQTVTAQLWPGVPILGEMETGYSDSTYMFGAGLPAYGITGVGIDEDDVRAHGKDERLRASAFHDGLQFFYLFLRAISPAAGAPH
jgi:acetylornithine deacetylase/succinyl-diaminopimelate desuccinylase-like protein